MLTTDNTIPAPPDCLQDREEDGTEYYLEVYTRHMVQYPCGRCPTLRAAIDRVALLLNTPRRQRQRRFYICSDATDEPVLFIVPHPASAERARQDGDPAITTEKFFAEYVLQ